MNMFDVTTLVEKRSVVQIAFESFDLVLHQVVSKLHKINGFYPLNKIAFFVGVF